MTNEEIKKAITDLKTVHQAYDVVCGDWSFVWTAIEALEKQVPKKPLAFWDGNESLIECPICKCPIDISEAEWSRQFCGKCGQRLE